VQASPALLEALAARRPSRIRPVVASLALFAAGAATFALWPIVSDWVAMRAERSPSLTPSAETVAALSPARKQETDQSAVPSVAKSAEDAITLAPVLVATTEVRTDVASPVSAKRATAPVTQAPRGAVTPEPSLPTEVEGEGVTPEPAEQAEAEPNEAASSAPVEGDAVEGAPLGPFDTSAAVTALSVAALQSGSCRKAGDPTGMARVVVTFAPSGRVTSSTVSGAPFAGTTTGGCIAGQFRAARVPAFEGPMVTVARSVVVE
jgi:hypothetical protein